MKNRILVIGGTGTIGSEVVKELQQNNADFTVLTRQKEKAQELEKTGISSVVGTLGDWSTVEPIFKEIDTLFLVTSSAFNMLDIHKGVIDLAVKNGVKKIVRSSAEPANYSQGMHMYEQHAAADVYLKKSGLEFVILQPHYFMQNIFFMMDQIKSQNSFSHYSGDVKIPMIDVRDIAKAAVKCLLNNDLNNNTFVLTGPTSISFMDVANSLTNVIGHEIQYNSLSYEDQDMGYKMFGLPDWQRDSVMKVFKKWVEGQSISPTNDFETITGLKPSTIEQFTKDHAGII